jgi:hypothetical protein
MTRPKTSAELAEMIATWLNVAGLDVAVQPDPFHGWLPVVTAPALADSYQQLADELAVDLRRAYKLNA